MSWTRYLLHDFWTAQEFNRRDRAVSRRRSYAMKRSKRDRAASEDLKKRIQELEDDLGSVALLARTLGDALLERGILNHEELVSLAAEIDAEDGALDGKAAPPSFTGPESDEPEGGESA